MKLPSLALLPLVAAIAAPGLAAEDPALAHARRLLAKAPVIDGHNDLPWAIRQNAKAPMDVGAYDGYAPLVAAAVKFFETGVAPVSPEETIEIFAFMEAADESKRRGGTRVTIQEVLEQAKKPKP